MGKHWGMLPKEMVNATSLKVLKARLDGLWAAWSTGRLPAHGKGLELDELEGPFKPKSFHNSVIPPN